MTSLLPDLERELVAAAQRRRRGGVRSWLRSRSRTVQALAALAVLGAAAASAAALTGTRSQPLSGAVAGDARYRITLTPILAAGAVGWCLGDQQTTAHGQALGGVWSCDDGTATLGMPLFARLADPGLAVITAPDVAAVRLGGGPTILTRAAASLPFGFRAAVHGAGRRLGGSVELRRESLVALDARGAIIPGGDEGELVRTGTGADIRLATRSWARVPADLNLLSPLSPRASAVAPSPPRGACATAARRGSGLRAQAGVEVTALAPDPAILGHAFLDCADTVYGGPGGLTLVSVLVDAARPGRPPAALPGMTPIAGHPGSFALPPLPLLLGSGEVARRDGDAWLVARDPPSLGHRRPLAVLGEVRVTRLDAAFTPVAARGPAAVPCAIGYRPRAGLLETVQSNWRGAPPAWGRRPRLYSCARAAFYLGDWPLEAQIFAPIAVPGAPRHPALHAIAGHPGSFAVAANGYSGPGVWRRVGRAWLVVTGGRGRAQQVALGERLTATLRPVR